MMQRTTIFTQTIQLFLGFCLGLLVAPVYSFGEIKPEQHNPESTFSSGTPLVEVIRKLEKDFEVQFTYESGLLEEIRLDRNVVFDALSFDRVLQQMGAPLDLEFKKINAHLYVITKTTPKTTEESAPAPSEQTAPEPIKISSSIEVSGRVTDDNGEPLIGVNIYEKGIRSNGTASDLDGSYNITVEGSESILVFSYLGYETQEITVGDQSVLNLVMASRSATLEEVVIQTSALKQGKQIALNQQRTADHILNIISADHIGRFPDLNVAEALQRVPGINIQRDKGEGSTVSVRGTPQHFTTIQINGEQIPSVQQSGSRNEALDLIPADQLAAMEITKAPTPDMDGDAIGGIINLRTPTARKYSWDLKEELAGGYNDLSGNMNAINKFSVGKRFFTSPDVTFGKLGVLLGASYYKNNNSEDRIDASWPGLPVPIMNLDESHLVLDDYQYRITNNVRTRMGITGTIDYKFNDDHALILKYMYNTREDKDIHNRLRFDMDRSGSIYQSLDSITGARIRRDVNISDRQKKNQSIDLSGEHRLESWSVNWSGFYTFSQRTFGSDRGDFARDEIDVVVDNPGNIFQDLPALRQAFGEQDMYDPFLYSDFRRYEEDFETTDADNLVGRFDVQKDFNLGRGHPSFLKMGIKYRTQSNSKFRDNKVFRFNDPNNTLNTNVAFLNVLSGMEPNRFLYSDYRFGPLIGRSAFTGYIDQHRRLLTTADDAWDSRRLSLEDTYDARENISAAYAMMRTRINQLMILAGLRYEGTTVNYDAYEVIRVGTDVSGTPIEGGNDFHFVLPNLHMKYNFDEYTALRFSSVFNYARPNFVDIVPYVNFDADAITLKLGNPDLLPARAFNLDAMFEKYFTDVGIVSVGLFYKNIDEFQFTRIDPSLADDYPGYPNTQGFEFRQEQNGDQATVAGFEFNFVRSLSFLPGFFRHLSLDGNYTYAYSSATTQDRDNISLPGQANHTFNVALSAEVHRFSGQISANYNGTFVNFLASRAQDDIFQERRLQVDANASYKIADQWRVFTEFTNLTNAPSIRYQGDRSRISRMAYFGWLARVGISFRL